MLNNSNVFNAGSPGPLHFRQVRGLAKTTLKTKEIWSGRGDSNARPPAPKADCGHDGKFSVFNVFCFNEMLAAH
jgi:hypothetical protein